MMRSLGAVYLIASCLSVVQPVFAQIATGGAIRGHVKDEQEAVLQGVRITATSPDAPNPFEVTSDQSGYYRLLDLPPGEYTISAELEGFAKWVRDGVQVRAGLNITVPVVMQLGTLAEQVTVTLDTPMLEADRPGQSVNVTGEMQRTVPITTRALWTDALQLTPGVIEGSGAGSYFVHGSSIDSHVFQVDGTDVMSARQNGSIFMNLNSDAIADVEIKVAGVDASSPLGVGAIVNVATTSGTDEFRGAVGITRQPRVWNSSNDPRGSVAQVDIWRPDLSLGGPVVRGRSWFYASFRHVKLQNDIARTAEQLVRLRALAPGFKPFGTVQKAPAFFVKSTTWIGDRHQLSALYSYDYVSQTVAGPTTAGDFLPFVFGGPVYGARLTSSLSSALFARVHVGYNEKSISGKANRDVPGRIVHQSTFLSSGRLVGTGALATLENATSADNDEPSSRTTVSADVTYAPSRGGGVHEIQAGVYLQPRLRYRQISGYRPNGFLFEEAVLSNSADLASPLRPFHRRVYEAEAATTRFLDNRDLAAYLQETWKPLPRLTLTGGLRVDWIKRVDRLFGETTQNTVAVGPRFGANYMLTGDSRHSVRASWGRVHENVAANILVAGTTVVGFQDLYDLDLDGTFEMAFHQPGRTQAASDRIFDPDLRQPYVQEWTLGYGSQWPGQVRVELGLTHRRYRDQIIGVESNGIYDGGVFRGYRNEQLNQRYSITNNIWNEPVYSGLTVGVTKQTRRWQFIGGWARQWRHVSGTWQPNDPASFIQPGAFANNRGIGDVRGSILSDSYSSTTSPLMWRDHAAQGGVIFQAPWDLQLAAHYTFLSGVWSGPIVTRLSAPDSRFGPPTVVLSNGRLVSNPLATMIRFAHGDRGEGQLRSPTVHRLNAHVARDFRWGGRRISLALDGFNVTNEGSDLAFVFMSSQQIFSPLYGATESRQPPRALQVSAKFAF